MVFAMAVSTKKFAFFCLFYDTVEAPSPLKQRGNKLFLIPEVVEINGSGAFVIPAARAFPAERVNKPLFDGMRTLAVCAYHRCLIFCALMIPTLKSSPLFLAPWYGYGWWHLNHFTVQIALSLAAI